MREAMNQTQFEDELDRSPENWGFREHYARWLLDHDNVPLARVQLWLAKNQKCPGPKCVLEGAWHEATWFSDDQSGQRWTLDYGESVNIKPQWCLPHKVFNALKGFITIGRRDKGFHNRFARSWNGRRDAEAAMLMFAVDKKKKKKLVEMRSLDALWDRDEFELKPLFE